MLTLPFIIYFGTNLCPKTQLPLRNHFLSFIGEFQKVLFGHGGLRHIFIFVKLYFAYRICIYYTISLHLGSFSGTNAHTWSKWKGKSSHFGSENSYVIGKAWRLFWSFWTSFYFLKPSSCSSWRSIYLSQCWTYLLLI